MKLTKKYSIKIPKNVKIIYNETNDILVCVGFLSTKLLKLKLKLLINNSKNLIYVTSYDNKLSVKQSKQVLPHLRGTTTTLIKQILLETSVILHKKLELVGVGYRSFIDKENLLYFKLGFSHFIVFKVPLTLKTICFKSTNVCFFGNSLQEITQLISKIRSYKKPEPYKGKGILYKNEKIILKEGKKV